MAASIFEQRYIPKSKLIENYIYLYHTDEYLILPTYPENIADSLPSQFSSTNALSRTAPTFSYSYSGPRQIQVNLTLHRDMLINFDTTYTILKNIDKENYIDVLIKKLQAIALPKYIAGSVSKSVIPPYVALRFGQEIYIKGVVQGGITITYSGPILENHKYAVATISFSVLEIDPYDAISAGNMGSFRSITRTFKNL